MAITVLVAYYSAGGTTRRLAEAVAEGAEKAGGEVRLRRAEETAPAEIVAGRQDWADNLAATDHLAPPTHEDLRWADAIMLGTPTRYGNIATPLMRFLETTGPLWFADELADKVVGGFASVGTAHGGHESTLLALSHVFHHWGALYVSPGYLGEASRAAGNPYGVSALASIGRPGPSEEELSAARAYGARVAATAGRLVRGALRDE
ncbi:NAD(P)H:quinone oxidoreductase, type IV [Actinophytocola xinjiangensis]|jgi:NAD(P)H dehydrogenase (quinone)|uniref:NAD(P)H:quinone oxidoreductase, type IV n=1 Tax=Actinophytocola xinjiangensis TaxID=485602 RepID=A0A7Z1B0Y2_9PSEU|nr:NAD(P)H:quinone oxidoreductase [Actinophytocola xinjiangensis]OLF12770.1 NAD(P)H:quinone oxidoreductase, type IV [Actinophytocola xinjiangensis]